MLHFSNRLRGSRVLLAGSGGLGAEVAKNLILAGVKGLTLLDHEQVWNSYSSSFFSLQRCTLPVYDEINL